MIHEFYGSLRKKENLVPLTGEYCQGAYVLNSPEPFPGAHSYYGELPHDKSPVYTYLILDEPYPLDRILRSSAIIMEDRDVSFEATPCKISLNKKKVCAIRIRGIDNYSIISTIVEAYRDLDLDFQSSSVKKVGGEALISVDKFFKIMSVGEGIFIGVQRSDHGYISIPRRLSWIEFEELTKHVKFNWNLPQFDVAIAYYYYNYQVFDIIRLYHPEMNQEYLRLAQQSFLSKLEV